MFDKQKFVVTEDHLKLVNKMYVGYYDDCEFGAPGVDPKRPYGNGDVYYDMAEILGIKPTIIDPDDEDYAEFDDEQIALLDKLHKETATVIQIILSTKKFKAGEYECDEYSINWEKVGG